MDGVTWAEYEEHLVENLDKLHEKLKSKTYRAQPLRRIYIDKEDGRKRPISVPSLDDKIVQRATVALLNAIFEQDFLNCSYGFRPGRSAHDALDEVGRVTCYGPTEYVLELDISSYFDSIVRKQLMEMVERICTVGSVRGGVGNGPAYSGHSRSAEFDPEETVESTQPAMRVVMWSPFLRLRHVAECTTPHRRALSVDAQMERMGASGFRRIFREPSAEPPSNRSCTGLMNCGWGTLP